MRALENRKPDKHTSSPFFEPKIQKKLKTGKAGDPFEAEADKVADQATNNHSADGGLLQSKISPDLPTDIEKLLPPRLPDRAGQTIYRCSPAGLFPQATTANADARAGTARHRVALPAV